MQSAGYAMISSSCSHRAESRFILRMAERTAQKMGTDRFRLSSQTLLFLLVLSGTPTVARSDTLEDSARELARKIDAVLTVRGELSCDIRNVSGLELDDVERIEQILKTELQGRCVRTQADGSEAANLTVTLSENVASLVWTGEIHQAGAYREILQAVPRSIVPPTAINSLPIVLARERFWEGTERILDAAFAASPTGDRLLILLLPDAVLIRNISKDSESRIDVPLAISTSELRESEGSLLQQDGNFIDVEHERHYCTVSLSTLTVVKCWDYQGEVLGFGGARLKGGQSVHVSTNCTVGKGIPSVVTGMGDDTQPDFVQVIVSRDLDSAIASNRIDFPGPVLAIHEGIGSGSATVIVRNLRTGNYEAYRLSISCGQ